jgi:hypothetical protein
LIGKPLAFEDFFIFLDFVAAFTAALKELWWVYQLLIFASQ